MTGSTHMLPSIYHLLNHPPSSKQNDDPPTSHDRQSSTVSTSTANQQNNGAQECAGSMNPISSSMLSQSQMNVKRPLPTYPSSPTQIQSLPPLEGNDPPRLLMRHSPPCHTLKFRSWIRPQHITPRQDMVISSPVSSCSSRTSSISLSPPPPPPDLPDKTPPHMTSDYTAEFYAPLTVTHPVAPPPTQIIINDLGEPVMKRRRGRPPSNRDPVWEGGWTFLTPTVWDVATPSSANQKDDTDAPPVETEESQMTAAFTSSDMETVLYMPKKKRGRKPKNQLAGNACFAWKDVPPARRSKSTSK